MIRVPVAPPPQNLINQIKAKKVIPIIGAGLSKSAQFIGTGISSLPDYRQLLEALLERANFNSESENIIRILLDAGKTNSKALERAARELREEMGDYPFYVGIRAILEPIDAQIQESIGHRLLRMVNFKRILTTNYDRFLEKFVAPDIEMFTARDIDAFRIFLAEPERGFILKLHGDITRPDTIPFGLSDLYRHYGYEADGIKLIKNIPPATKTLRDFMESIFRNNTVLFLGSSVAYSEGYARILLNLVQEWGGSLPYTHYALVPKDPSLKALREHLSSELNLRYIEYEPDNVHSQVWEFIAFLNAGVFTDEPKPGKKWGQSYLSDRRVEYLERQLERETTARSICFLTPSLTNAVTTLESLEVSTRKGLQERYTDKLFVDKVMDKMLQRKENLEKRLDTGELNIRIIFLESELKNAFQTTDNELAKTIQRYEYLLQLVNKPNLEVRLLPHLTAQELRDIYSASFALIFNETKNVEQPESDVALAYASQATINYFEIHIIQINTSEVKDRVYQFERFWSSSLNEAATIQSIQALIALAKTKVRIDNE